MKIVSETGRAH